MNKIINILTLATFLLSGASAVSCINNEDMPGRKSDQEQKRLGFDISVTREGAPIPSERIQTRGGGMVDASELIATMDKSRPFGLIGVEKGTHSILIDNEAVYSEGSGYAMYLSPEKWEIPTPVAFSAYYPHVSSITYGDDNSAYAIPFTVNETDAGPLVSKTVERFISQINTLPLEFGHITNDIGYKVCDATPKKELQGLIHLRKLTATNVASAGVYVNDLMESRGNWSYQGYYRKVVVFEGDALVGVGSENEKFVGSDALVDRLSQSNRYYSIPDDIEIGKQYVEVVFDVDGFRLNNFDYPPLKDQVYKYMLYGLLPDNEFVPGKQYTFHIGLDLSTVYHEITFAPAVSGWETKIYENNDDF